MVSNKQRVTEPALITSGLLSQLRRSTFTPADNKNTSEFWDHVFDDDSGSANKELWIPFITPSPRVAGGSVLSTRKKRFKKKQRKWMQKAVSLSYASFLSRNGIERKEWRGM